MMGLFVLFALHALRRRISRFGNSERESERESTDDAERLKRTNCDVLKLKQQRQWCTSHRRTRGQTGSQLAAPPPELAQTENYSVKPRSITLENRSLHC